MRYPANKKKKFLKISLLSFTLVVSFQVEAVQDVYEYKNKQGVTEFTDEPKANKTPEKHFQIKKMTPEEEALSKQKLDKIIEKDAELDKRLAHERQMENERRRKFEEQQALKNRQEPKIKDDNGNNDLRDDWYYRRPVRPGYPGKPTHPIDRPKPNPGKKTGQLGGGGLR